MDEEERLLRYIPKEDLSSTSILFIASSSRSEPLKEFSATARNSPRAIDQGRVTGQTPLGHIRSSGRVGV